MEPEDALRGAVKVLLEPSAREEANGETLDETRGGDRTRIEDCRP